MPTVSQTMAQLSRFSSARQVVGGQPESGRLTELTGFGSNPGQLRALTYVPEGSQGDPALVVVLHGCTQTAAGYDAGAGWSELADRRGFVLLFPEQRRQNNPNLCFNWYDADDHRRGAGEALSIRQMIGTMVERHGVDPARIFVTGLSAGGAMASVMLATYPEVFAGGAIIAGLPYGRAQTLPEALGLMHGRGERDEADMASLVRNASDHRGPWPIISVWHGSGDTIVNPSNARAILSQWRALHGVATDPDRTVVDGYPRRVWRDAAGREVIEEYSITGLGHGTPLDTLSADGCGRSGAHMLEASISSTGRICEFWGLAAAASRAQPHDGPAVASGEARARRITQSPQPPNAREPAIAAPAGPGGVGRIIEDALRAARLMR